MIMSLRIREKLGIWKTWDHHLEISIVMETGIAERLHSGVLSQYNNRPSWSCSCCLVQLFCRKLLAPVSLERNSSGNVISGFLIARKTQSCSLQGCNFTNRGRH